MFVKIVHPRHFLIFLLLTSLASLLFGSNEQSDAGSAGAENDQDSTGVAEMLLHSKSTTGHTEESQASTSPHIATDGLFHERINSSSSFREEGSLNNNTEQIIAVDKVDILNSASTVNKTKVDSLGMRNFSSTYVRGNWEELLQNKTEEDLFLKDVDNSSTAARVEHDSEGDSLNMNKSYTMLADLNETNVHHHGSLQPEKEKVDPTLTSTKRAGFQTHNNNYDWDYWQAYYENFDWEAYYENFDWKAYYEKYDLPYYNDPSEYANKGFYDPTWDKDHFTWDKSLQTPEHYHAMLCGRVCIGGELMDIGSLSCATIHCSGCICERPKCEIYGMCCPDDPRGLNFFLSIGVEEDEMVEPIELGDSQSLPSDRVSEKESGKPLDQETRDSSMTSLSYEEARAVKCYNDSESTYLYVQSCPLLYGDSQTRKLCEEDSPPAEDTTLDTFTRVSDNGTGVVYRNVFCARCNNVTELVQWEVSIECDTYMYVYSATTTDQLLNISLRPGSHCSVEQYPGISNTSLVPCIPEWWSLEEVDRCNVTGLWPEYDDDVHTACESIGGREYRVEHDPHQVSEGPRSLYKNVFCAICNMGGYPPYGHCKHPQTDRVNVVGEGQSRIFSFLLGFSKRRRAFAPTFEMSSTFSACSEGEWSSPDGSCMKVHCSAGKLLKADSCVTALDQIRGLSYSVQLWFELLDIMGDTIPDTDQKVASDMVLKGIFKQIVEPLDEIAKVSLDYGIILLEERNGDQDRMESTRNWPPLALWASAILESNDSLSRDNIEKYLTERFTRANLHFNFSNNYQMEFQSKAFPAGPPKSNVFCVRSGLRCDSKYIVTLEPKSNSYDFIKATEILNCPYIRFHKTMFDVYIQDSGALLHGTTVIVKIGGHTLNFTKTPELHFMTVAENETLKVCRDVLDAKLKMLEEEKRRDFHSKNFGSKVDNSSKAQYYLTLVCVSVSMVCLLLTLFTYFTFCSLRSVAGLNNMFLCGSLLLAQASLLASAHVSGPRPLCTVLGIMTHFLWLWMFVWSFICCFHMFRVFTTKTRNSCSSKSQMSRCVWSVALSFITPAVVICTVVTASHVTSSGSRTGYGHDFCYLDSPLLVGLATVLPLALVCLANIVFFAITVLTIHKIRRLQTHVLLKQDDRENLYIYVKLSTMTGVFWLVQILAEAVDLDVLRYVAIVLNGLQGAFIFFSYTWNKRVLNLYMRSLGLNPMTSTSATSQNQRRAADFNHPGVSASPVRKVDNQNTPSTISNGKIHVTTSPRGD